MLLLSIFIFLWLNDSGAYLVGSTIGKHRLFERISPKKSWEGFWGGLVLSVLAGYVMGAYFNDIFHTSSRNCYFTSVFSGSVDNLLHSVHV